MGGHGWRTVGGAAEMRFRDETVKIWVIGAVFGGCGGGVGVIENVDGRFNFRGGVHETFVVTRTGSDGGWSK